MKHFLKALVAVVVVAVIVGGGVFGYQTYLKTVQAPGSATVVVSGDFSVSWPTANGYPDSVTFGNVTRGEASAPIPFTISSLTPEELVICAHGEGTGLAGWTSFVWGTDTVDPTTEEIIARPLAPQGGADTTVNLALDVPTTATTGAEAFTLYFGSVLNGPVTGTVTPVSSKSTVSFALGNGAPFTFSGQPGDTFTHTITLQVNAAGPAETSTTMVLAPNDVLSATATIPTLPISTPITFDVTFTILSPAAPGDHPITLTFNYVP